MRPISKYITLGAAAVLILVFFFPLWRITLGAPQYPEPLHMYIWIDQITGSGEFTIQNINILNHYIGMAPIHPESFPELQYMPWILGALIGIGFLAGFIGKKWLLYSWVILLLAAGAAGLYDFYHWEYEFGHNLDPRAPIKLPGMTYSPPFLGTKVLLNIVATSLPATGGILLFVGILLAIIAALLNIFKRKEKSIKGKPKSYSSVGSQAAVLFLVASFAFAGCSKGPEPIEYGFDACHFCKMTIADARYGSELVTDKGKIFKFDAAECMAGYIQRKGLISEDIHSLWVSDFSNPGTLVEARKATFLQSKELPSPMGMYLNAFSAKEKAEMVQEERGGRIMDWTEVLELTDTQAVLN